MSEPTDAEIRTVQVGQPYEFPWGKIFGERESLDRENRWLDHYHPAHELLWSQGGAATIVVGRRLWTIAGSHGLWLPAGTIHSGTVRAGVTYRATFFDVERTQSISDVPVSVEITPLLTQLLDHLEKEHLREDERTRAEGVVMDLLQPVEQAVILHMPSHELISAAAEEILADPAAPHGVDYWAKRLGVSTRTITRTFRAETGVGFARWVATARARCAIELLSNGVNVAEAAERVGYATVSAFGVAFRRVTGVTPGAFRQQQYPEHGGEQQE